MGVLLACATVEGSRDPRAGGSLTPQVSSRTPNFGFIYGGSGSPDYSSLPVNSMGSFRLALDGVEFGTKFLTAYVLVSSKDTK